MGKEGNPVCLASRARVGIDGVRGRERGGSLKQTLGCTGVTLSFYIVFTTTL